MAMGAGTEPDYQAMDVAMEENTAAYLDAFTKYGTGIPTEGRGNQLLEPVAGADGYKQINLTLSIIDWEVEPGKVVKAWAYNDMVPGPWIKVQPNDKLRVTLTNNSPMGQDIHWHGISTPFGQDGVAPITQPMIEPGQTYTYEFNAPDVPEMGMYHPHNGGSISVINGAYGQFQVGELPAAGRQDRQRHQAAGQDRGHQGTADGAQRRRHHRPVAERQVLPGDRSDRGGTRARPSRSRTTTRASPVTRCTSTG